MKMDPRRMNYIGKRVKVMNARNKALIGIEGLIVDETMKTLKVMVNKEIKTILKKGTILLIENQYINGDEIQKRQVDRINMKIREVFKIKQQPLMV